VLFIDEAYSLLDDKEGLYGDEAISTIVQEMENHRDDTIVIFAGYPAKMEQFLTRNPGLQSRIAFHVSFADYNTEELWQIMELFAQKANTTLAPETKDKLTQIFSEAIKHKDFGNGRFVRNIYEKAKMKQAGRLIAMNPDAVTNVDITTLTSEDFDVPLFIKHQQNRIGFSCNSG
jgi:adenylate kinase family enzyme